MRAGQCFIVDDEFASEILAQSLLQKSNIHLSNLLHQLLHFTFTALKFLSLTKISLNDRKFDALKLQLN